MEHLCKSLIAAYVFLEFSGDDLIDPDAAVKAMEAMTAELQSSSAEEKEALIQTCAQEAAALRSASHDEQIAQFIADLPQATGLIEYDG
ncbi:MULTISPECIES: hypothetical protein [Xanthomonas]|uniref:hypothetical protein n=1 Tax=Xanthomonas TaxID=338 RepID=UPI00141A8DD8|nr:MULTISPECIES: hypothetical protein [Xanthomonas]MBB4606211.1 hypothetical protein [Xanthomonas arboricola]MBB5766137.1 hypothetical protein [Xanthomonas euroxanthea]NIK09017.1 hypothetical protein [Xanthomonas euroxanthea]